MIRRDLLSLAFALLAAFLPAPGFAAGPDDAAWQALSADGIVLFRHATAPGIGDPPGMSLEDCSTQRNLSEAGRAQARQIGARFRDRGVAPGAVLTSRWCRARETADLAFPGRAKVEPAFDSFFGNQQSREAQTRAARALLLAWRGPGVLFVSTHQVNITALTGRVPSSGEGIVLKPEGDELVILGSLKP
ncbi:hypothetical protein FHS85_001927 [Rhodoligotrophos appendicifer]|uniref:histidine phosphatase family protein n=1 Tax=Rhodoligotrophos appendicifer TaxID=987056 RepID=UPI001186AAD6|nr:histidine phosphatase family protein [Rhodoligotrophos appendicifer]